MDSSGLGGAHKTETLSLGRKRADSNGVSSMSEASTAIFRLICSNKTIVTHLARAAAILQFLILTDVSGARTEFDLVLMDR